ncbi:MAG: ATP-grasp domain-containing protein [Oscillospiraceae bacterium]|nr:ATP-grasp domain-containing protein [Oscillospiraceae bacterium]
MKKLAIIGASYLQNPLILKAKEMGLETHVFAWQCGDIGETTADFFYPISILEKDAILEKCREIGVNGVCTIATDLGAVTVNYVANRLGLTANTDECTYLSTNKHAMREAFFCGGDPSPKSFLVDSADQAQALPLAYPVIVKPTDRSGSRGITKLYDPSGLADAIRAAQEQGFEKKALVEEFAEGEEYSVECISFGGEHHYLAMTKKFTTGAPHFIETGHLEPAPVSGKTLEMVKSVVFHALDTLKIQNGASHSELKIAADGTIRLIEIGGRMGGDCIGSDLVFLSTGVDFVRAVIQVALGQAPDLTPAQKGRPAAVRFVFTQQDLDVLQTMENDHPEYLVRTENLTPINGTVSDSSMRFGAYLMCADDAAQLAPYLPEHE